MKELLGKMKQAQPFFVRCIKPNDQQAPDQFVDMKVRQQLKYNGITEIARIRRVWFPVKEIRKAIPNVLSNSYCDVVPDSKLVTDKKNAVRTILHGTFIGEDEYKIGNKMVFLKEQANTKLEDALKKEKARQMIQRAKEEKERKEREKKKQEELEKRNQLASSVNGRLKPDMQAMKFIKFFAYVFFFIIVLASSTAQKVSFMLMVSALNTTIQTGMPAKEVELKKAEKSAYYILAVVAVCLPYLLSFITSLAKVTFGAFKSPSPTTWIWMSVFPVIFVLGYIDYDESDILTMVDIVGALVFVSCSHWENFMDGRFFVTLKDGNWWKQLMLKRRFEMDRGRYITVLVTSVCKILATIALAYLFRGDRDQDYRSALDTLSGLQAEWKAITAIITLTLSGIISYYFAYIACKLWMQKMCYTIPLSLATPCAFLVFYLDQRFGFLGEVTSSGVTWPEELRDDWTSLVAGGAWWLTLLLLTRHVWFPRQSRLAKIESLDWEQFMRQKAEEIAGTEDPDFFNYEAHVFFDDAMTLDDDEEFIPNSYVTLLVEVMEEAVSSVHKKTISVKPPLKIPTPYGGQLVWVMPGGNLLFVHMKDKAKIRHRKRWSQVMYMYYLLGFRLTRQCEEQIVEALKSGGVDHHKGWKLNEESEIFELLDENVARMMFEYAIGHWMQKATEHVLGCVLCSPGCFSLFRGSALMDDNVMRKYTILPTEPGHFLQYDQGEDRWLCTLLLQQGYRVDYAAAADAWTYAPEGFNEFFNQRRSNISVPYIAYQVALMVATILGPGTVLMMIAGAIEIVFGTSLIWSYVIACAPAAVFLVVCLKCKTNIQLTFYAFVMMVVFVGVIITAVTDSIFHPSVLVITVLIMIFVVAGIFHPLELFCLPSGILYLLVIPSGYLLLVIYSLANLHVVSWGTREVPKKKTKKELEEEQKEAEEKAKKQQQKKGLFERIFGGSSYLSDIKEILNSAVGRSAADKDDRSVKLLEEINENIKKLHAGNDSDSAKSTPQVTILVSEEAKAEDKGAKSKQKKKKSVKIVEAPPEKPPRDDLKNPKWIEHEGLGSGEHMQLYEEELQFWQNFIKRYLKPLDADKKKEKEEGAKLIELRNQVVFAVTMTNLLWMAINFMFQLKVPFTIDFTIDGNLIQMDILGMLFMIFLITILLLQLIGMFIHRWGTLLHLLAFTDIELPCLKKKSSLAQDKEKNFKKVLEFCKKVYEEPLPDYLEDDDGHGNSQLGKTMKDRLRETVLGTSTRQPAFRAGPAASADFANSPAVNLYLRATQKGGADDDLTVRDFAEKFAQYRDTIGASDRDVPNGRPGGEIVEARD
nr:hypothetical protein BaRGS_026484 [Batillaria attramentaria]